MLMMRGAIRERVALFFFVGAWFVGAPWELRFGDVA